VTTPARTRSARPTRQGDAVLRAVRRGETFRSAQEIHADLRQADEAVGLATVYRHLQALADEGVIDAVTDAQGQTLYRHCETPAHHHHVVCRECGRSAEIEGPEVERWVEGVADRLGYTEVTHVVELSGRCADCRA
jgi:Fur family ferric uptake transcriptional regulator